MRCTVKPARLQHAFEKRERAAFRRRDRAAAQQIAGNGDGIGGHWRQRLAYQSLSNSLMLVLERVRSSTRLTMTAQ